jgi:cathepsin L
MTASDLKTLLVDSPVGALINADSGFMSYSSGVYSGCPADFATSRSAINHAVIIVGYDSNGNWIIKNSWGTGWGQSGFATISVTNDCALTAYVYQLTW